VSSGRRARHRRGFSALELLVTLAIVGVLLVAALPPLQERLAAGRARRAAHEVASRIDYARRQALRDGVPRLVICKEDRFFFVVADRDRDREPDPGEPREGPYSLPSGTRVRVHPRDPFSSALVAVRTDGDAEEAGSYLVESGKAPPLRVTVSTSRARCEVALDAP
jgi:type IV fimbrial biogenesis protein FimT